MKSRVLLNLVLLAMVIGLGFAIMNLDSGEDIVTLSDFDKDLVNSIEIQHRDRYIVLKKTGDHWQMTRPINIAANDFRIGSVLKFIDAVSNAQYAVSDIDLSRYKLDKPATSIRFSDGVRDIKFEFGSANPINRMRYVRSGDTMHLIEDQLYPLVSSQMGTLISPRLLPDGTVITSLALPDQRFDKTSSGWQVDPENITLDSDTINGLIDSWQHAQAFGVHDYLEREELGEVSIHYTQEGMSAVMNLVVTDTDPWLIIANPELGIEYHLDITLYDTLFTPGYERDSAILDAEQNILDR